MILTTDSVKAYLLNTKIANTFQIAGLDLTNHIISFDDLGGIWKITDDATIAASDIDKFTPSDLATSTHNIKIVTQQYIQIVKCHLSLLKAMASLWL